MALMPPSAVRRWLLRAAWWLLLPAAVVAQAAPAPAVRWQEHSTTGSDGKPLRGELGRLEVPLRPGSAATLELAFVRYRSTSERPGPPIFYLVGGPGPSGIEHCVKVATGRLVRLLEHGDVIGIDQRGTGRSRPDLASAPFACDLPLDRAVTRDAVIAAFAAATRRCAAHWQAAGVDLTAFDTERSADDLDAVRQALQVEHVVLWGESYGTHLGLAYLRRYSQHVARAVLVRTEGPDHTLKLPSTTQRHLERMHELVAADPTGHALVPDLLATVKQLRTTLAAEPAPCLHSVDGEEHVLTVGVLDFDVWLANTLGLAFEFRDLPAALAAMADGDFAALGATAWWLRRGPIDSAMPVWVDCRSGISAARRAQLAAERADPRHLLADAVNLPFPDLCAACGIATLPDAYREPFRSEVPVLFVSGGLDARTPPENVVELRAWFPRSVHVIADHAGHESLEVMVAAYRDLLATFLRGEAVADTIIALPQPRFRARPPR
jgi:pimeloyl-ACP methyl ester carboxylesterase